MKIVLNTYYPHAPASEFYLASLNKIESVTLNDFNNYDKYDIALFMTYPKDIEECRKTKIAFPQLITGVIDPRSNSAIEPFLDTIDFFIVDGIEMKDFFSGYGKPILMYSEYPDIPVFKKNHTVKKPIVIGYHGNKVHLVSMYPHITYALDKLAEEYELEFWAVYNIDQLGLWKTGVPKRIKIRHIQWTPDVYVKELSHVDIGIVPNLLPMKNVGWAKHLCATYPKFFNENQNDYLIRFKMPSNAGRILVFGKLGIPVVSDMFPSGLQCITDGINGFIAYSSGGWYYSLRLLIEDYKLRNKFATEMQRIIAERYEFNVQNKRLMTMFENLISKKFMEKGNSLKIFSPRKSLTFNINMRTERVMRQLHQVITKLKKINREKL